MPISDLYMLLESGGVAKEAWVNPNGGHTGRSDDWPNAKISEQVIAPWVKAHLAPDTGSRDKAKTETSAITPAR